MEITFYHPTSEDILSKDFIVSCKEKIASSLKPLAKKSDQYSKKFQFDELILDQKDLNRIELILNNKDIIVTKSNFNFFTKISEKLNFTSFLNFLRQTDFDSLETSYELLLTLESLFIELNNDSNFDIAINLLSSIATEIEGSVLVNLLYNMCYTSTKDDIIKKVLDFIQKVSLTFPFIQIFNYDQERISLEKGQHYMYDHKPEFKFLSYYAYIPLNQRIMIEMRQRNIKYDLYRENLEIYYYLNCTKTMTPIDDDPIFSIMYKDDVEKLQQIMINSEDHYLNLEMTLHDSESLFNFKMCLLDIAAYFGSIKCFKYLLLKHAIQSDDLPIFAVMGQNYEIVHICDQNNCFSGEFQNNSSLEAAFLFHNGELFQWLTENKNLFDLSYYQKLFTRAIKTSNYKIMDFIYQLCNDNDVNIFTDRSFCAICEMNNSILFEWAIEKVGELSSKQLQLCFLAASEKGNWDILKKILDLGIDEYKYYRDITPLHYVTVNADFEIVKKTYQMNKNVLNSSKKIEKDLTLTPLMIAFKNKRYDVAEFFLSLKDININAIGKIDKVFESMDVYIYVCFLDDYQAFSMLLNTNVFSKLDLKNSFVAYYGGTGKVVNHEYVVQNARNNLIRNEAKKFHK